MRRKGVLGIICTVCVAVAARNQSVPVMMTKYHHIQHPNNVLVAVRSSCTGSELYLHLIGVVEGPIYDLRLEVSRTHRSPAAAVSVFLNLSATPACCGESDRYVVRLLLPAGVTGELHLSITLRHVSWPPRRRVIPGVGGPQSHMCWCSRWSRQWRAKLSNPRRAHVLATPAHERTLEARLFRWYAT